MLTTTPTSSRKGLPNSFSKDLWLATSEGSLSDVDVALAWVKKNGGNVDARNAFGLTPLHIATWRNNVPIVRRLLAAGADPNAKDVESGWSSLHRALHFGHLAVASVLLQSSSSITLEDSKSRTPIDLLSGPVLQAMEHKDEVNAVSTEVFSWGSGVNYQLGTGNVHIQKLPCKIDTLRGSHIKLVSAAKYHSVAITESGEVYTWGFGRGGRLGHPELDIHSGQGAVITPMPVTSGFDAHVVVTVAAAKHHTVAATKSGDVFTWGSNREGQLGYRCSDTQPTPRRVNALKSWTVAVAAANKHTAVISSLGEVFTWGCNKEGQLGYETLKSSSSYTPRCVDSLRNRVLTNVAAAKYHTIVLGAEGEVFTWGHGLVTPRRVVISRNIKKAGNNSLQFHKSDRLRIILIAAGVTHSVAVTNDGALFFWVSSDPNLRSEQLFSLARRKIVSVSAGKYWTGVVTDTGDVFTLDGKKEKSELPVATRLHGLKKATSISVGETHLLIVSSLYYPRYSDNIIRAALSRLKKPGTVPSLLTLCQIPAIVTLLEPKTCLQLLEIADSLEAASLRSHCEKMAIRNLDYILAVATQAFTSTSLELLLSLEKKLHSKSSEKWSYRRLPTPTATTCPAIINSEEDDSEDEFLRARECISPFQKDGTLSSSLQCSGEVSKHVRALKKKLQQIEMLEEKLSMGHSLDDQQMMKIQTRRALENALSELGVSMETMQTKSPSPVSGDGITSKRVTSRKKKGKSKHKVAEGESSVDFEQSSHQGSTESNLVVETSFVKHKDKDAEKKGYADSSSSVNNDSVGTGEMDKGTDLCKDPGKQVSDDSSSFTKDFGGNNHSPLSASKKKNKKGGLSMFLNGGLDDTPKPAVPPPPVVVKSEGPAWGGVKIAKGPSSLREILVEQINTTDKAQKKLNNAPEDVSGGNNKIPLGSFLQSCPKNIDFSDQMTQIPAPILPPSSSSPSSSRQSLRDIQMQQMEEKAIQDLKRLPASIRAIQMEEQAKQDMKRFYGHYKAVK